MYESASEMTKKQHFSQRWVIPYTMTMSFFVKSTSAVVPKTTNVRFISLGLAAIFTTMAVAQLFTFEKFPDVIMQMWLPYGGLALILAAFIVTLEVVALPFLLFMRLSPAMRVVSMVAGWLGVVAWLGISLWENISGSITANSGLLGDTISLPVGWWSVLVCVALGVLMAWASWGMWPFASRHR
jgi:hypothetical protein